MRYPQLGLDPYMKQRRPSLAALPGLFIILGFLGLIAWGCSGPQSLSVAMHHNHEQAYTRYLDEKTQSPREAFFAWKASDTGTNIQELAHSDQQVPSTRNPFDAHRDADAVSRGAVIYQAHCLSCHGQNVDGLGPAMPEAIPKMDFHSFGKRLASTLHRGAPKSWFRKISMGYTSKHVNADGSHSSMPAMGQTLAREQIWLAITYLQSLDIHAVDLPEGN